MRPSSGVASSRKSLQIARCWVRCPSRWFLFGLLHFLQGICVLGSVLHSTTGPQRKRPDLAHLLSLAHSSPWVLTHGRELYKDTPETSFCLPDPLPIHLWKDRYEENRLPTSGKQMLSLSHARGWEAVPNGEMAALEVTWASVFSVHPSKLLEVSYGSNRTPLHGRIHREREGRHRQSWRQQ